MIRKLSILISGLILAAVFFTAVTAQEKAAKEEKASHEYVGVKKCRLCHKKDGVYPSWMETKHANAFEALSEEDRTKEECIGCHTTGTTAKGVLLEGIQCEACHGPGSDYNKKSIMENLDKAIANGLLLPDTTTCKKCHNENVPEEFRPEKPYNFAEMMKTGIHDVRKETE
jgi:hypothetical protein